MSTNKLPAQPNQSLIHGMSILREVATNGAPLSCAEISKKLKIDVTKVNRILKTLNHLGFVLRTENRHYSAGPAIHVLAAQSLFASKLLQKALPELDKLRRFGRITALGLLWETNVSYLYHNNPKFKITESIGRIGLYPATESSIGMVLLSKKSDNEIQDIYANNELGQYKSVGELISDLDVIRLNGWANVPSPDGRSVAVSVGKDAGAAIAIAGKMTDADVKIIVEALQSSANAISS